MIQVRFWRHRLLVPISSECSEIIIKGSRFLAESFIISSQNQVREILKSQKQKYSDSTHVVHAFIAGKNGEIMGMSDDGEPSGTAGRPMLDVLKGRNCTNLMITVTRWFGGTLLGTGGLVHAYGDCTKSVLEKKQEKWQKVMYEASKQCERAVVPICYEPTIIEKVLENDFDKILVLAERSTEISLKQFLLKNPIKKSQKILVIIGPEGGFSQREFEFFKSKNLPLISLGDLILKAETAVIVALGDIVYEYQG